MEKELVEGRAVTMFPSDWSIVEAADTGAAGVSATLRRIVREWYDLTRSTRMLVDSPIPYTTCAHFRTPDEGEEGA